MTGQSRRIDEILQDRMETIQAIAAANTTQLRLTQKASGLMVLDMKDVRDGVEHGNHDTAQARNQAALETTLARIDRLQQALARLDDELEAAVKEEGA